MKKALYIIGAVLLIIILADLTQYHADIPLDELKPAYAPPPSRFMMMDGATVHYRDEGTGFPIVTGAWHVVITAHLANVDRYAAQ